MRHKTIKGLLTLAAAVIGIAGINSCMKEQTTDTFETSKKILDAWMKKYHPDAVPSGRGIYVIDSIPGTGASLTDSTTYVFVDFTISDLSGNYVESTSEAINKRIGKYEQSNYYGPEVLLRNTGVAYAGVEDMLDQMKVGGYLKAVIPSWLMNTKVYDSEEKYQKEDQGGAHYIYEITITDATHEIEQWELDTLKKYSDKYYGGIDTLKAGFYYKTVREGRDTIANDSTFYIRYIGKLLNGHVFDTNIADSAKFYGIYDEDRDYDTPAKVVMKENAEDITMDGSTVVQGFYEALKLMHWYETATAFFVSDMGYGSEGSGNKIPAFAPLQFTIEVVEYED